MLSYVESNLPRRGRKCHYVVEDHQWTPQRHPPDSGRYHLPIEGRRCHDDGGGKEEERTRGSNKKGVKMSRTKSFTVSFGDGMRDDFIHDVEGKITKQELKCEVLEAIHLCLVKLSTRKGKVKDFWVCN